MNIHKVLSTCKSSLEFIVTSLCQAFKFKHSSDAVLFLQFQQHEDRSKYCIALRDINNFSKINTFISVLQTNLKTLITIMETENNEQDLKNFENSSHFILMNILALGLSKSQDKRIVW
jgi:hypothetical protein